MCKFAQSSMNILFSGCVLVSHFKVKDHLMSQSGSQSELNCPPPQKKSNCQFKFDNVFWPVI